MKCRDCRFAVIGEGDGGHCYRYPPTLIPPNTAAYPPVALDRFWCGEFNPPVEVNRAAAAAARKKGKPF